MNKNSFAINYAEPVAVAYGALVESLPEIPVGWPTLCDVKNALGVDGARPLRSPGYVIGDLGAEDVAEIRLRQFIASSTAWRDALFSQDNPDRNHPENAQKWNRYLSLWDKPDLASAVRRAFSRKRGARTA